MPYKDRERQRRAAAEHFVARHKKRRERLRNEVACYKEDRGCADCGGSYPSYVLQLDHRPGSGKVENVSEMISQSRGREEIFAEIAKCEVVCANCHAIRTYKRQYGVLADVSEWHTSSAENAGRAAV
jgi:hypothetical protein